MEFIDLKAQYKAYKENLDAEIMDCISSAEFILGNKEKQFESNLSKYIGIDYSIGCASGTDALQLIYMACGLGTGDAIFCPDMTFIASIEPACLMGATPVFCDIDYDTFNISVDSLEKQINNVLREGKLTPKVIVAVDFLGNPADYDGLMAVARKYGLLLVEDAAQGVGAVYQGKKCGALGDIGATSFFPSKPLGCYGDGGAVFTNDSEYKEVIQSLRVHGKGKTKYDNVRIGLNSRLDTIQAAVLDVKLRHLDDEMKIRQEVVKRYREELNGVVHMQLVKEGNYSSYAQFVICMNNQTERDAMKNHLEEKGIPTIVYYPNALHNLPVFKDVECYGENLYNAVKYGQCNLGLPFSAFLREEDQNYVIGHIKSFFGGMI